MTRTLALVDVDGKISMLDLMNLFRVPGQEGTYDNAVERYRSDSNVAALGVAAVIEEYAHESSLTFRDAVAYYIGFACESKVEIWVTKGLLDKAKEIVLGMEIFMTRSGNILRVLRFRFSNGMSVQILLGGHSTLSLESNLSENHDEEKNSKGSCIYSLGSHVYQIVCTRPDIASADVGMLNGFDRLLQTDIYFFLDFNYAMGRSITFTGRSITMYGFMIQESADNTRLNGLFAESGFELRLVAGIATCDLTKVVLSPKFQHWLKLLRIREG
nr:zinc finger, CCHC-type [Tanacetum cinerariifolium]